MILTEEQAKERLESSRNLLSRFGKRDEPKATVDIIPINRHDGRDNAPKVPEETRIAIAARARLGENQDDLAREFGVGQQTVSTYKTGRVPIDEAAVAERINQVQDVAMAKLLKSLGFLDDEKLSKLGAKDLSAIAANMSKVVGNTRVQPGDQSQVHLHLYAPELRKESSFKTIEVHSA